MTTSGTHISCITSSKNKTLYQSTEISIFSQGFENIRTYYQA